MNYKIALIKGDGIGPEIVDEAVKVLDRVGVKYGHTFDYARVLMLPMSFNQNRFSLSSMKSITNDMPSPVTRA